MRILLLTTHLNRGGIGIYTVNLARYLKKKGIEVGVASSGGDLVSVLGREGITHHYLNIRTKSEFGIKVFKALPRLTALINDKRYDIVHAQTRVTQILASMAGRWTGIPFVSTGHGFFNHRRLSRRLFPCWGEKVVAISNSVKEHLINDLAARPEKVEMIYNGIELERYRSVGSAKDEKLAEDMGLDERMLTVGTIGRLSSVKGYKYLISALKEVVDSGCNVQLVMVGEGPEEDNLKDQIRDLDLEDKVFVTPGEVSLEKYMTLFDIFCLPSIHEGLGLSLMEAMAAGRA
ncbi:MAG: glycosyltransferase, partial [Candidatus Tantalella remota]|nr:glycosyltransferase [Candidatus Tantalella remota]